MDCSLDSEHILLSFKSMSSVITEILQNVKVFERQRHGYSNISGFLRKNSQAKTALSLEELLTSRMKMLRWQNLYYHLSHNPELLQP